MLAKVRVNYTPCHQDPVRDSMNTVHSPVGKVELRWYKKGKGKSHAETFYVVDRPQPLVILGATAFGDKNIPTGKEIHPIGLKEQTAGNVFGIEQKAELERKRKEVAERRALETKEQERREAEKRLQGDQRK
ncbi:MAG: hypothetical protein Q9177_004996 [Variospora cf. flavescens]